MRPSSSFIVPINEKDSAILSNTIIIPLVALFSFLKLRRSDRNHHQFFMCPVNGYTSTFEFSEDLDVHIAANLHKVLPPNPRTANDIARYHLIDTVRSANVQYHQDMNGARKRQSTSSIDMSNSI